MGTKANSQTPAPQNNRAPSLTSASKSAPSPSNMESANTATASSGLPVRPSTAPSSPGSAGRALASILQRAEQFTSAALNARNAQNPAANPTNDAPALGTIQRKAHKLTPVTTLKTQASTFFKDDYDAVISEVEAYLNDSTIPEKNFGRRLIRLPDIRKKIDIWEKKHGSVNQAIPNSFITSGADKRRPLLKALDATLAVEKDQVEKDGLAEAQLAHTNDRVKLQEYLNEAGTSTERRLKNTAQWFALGKAKLYALTPTGDSEARIAHAKMNINRDEAWFPTGKAGGAGHMLDAPVKYNEKDITDKTNVTLDPDGKVTGGWNTPQLVAITNAAKRSKDDIFEVLRHEVQHDADWNKGRDSTEGVATAGKEFDSTGASLTPTTTGYSFTGTTGEKTAGIAAYKTHQAEIALTRYKTEYRAYSYEGGPGGRYLALDNTIRNQSHGGKLFTLRQLEIFKHVYQGYEYTKTHWDANTALTGGRNFKDEVVNYYDPDTEALNKYNSPAVDDFYRALDKIGVKEASSKLKPLEPGRDVEQVSSTGKVSNSKDVGVVALLDTIYKLSTEDAEYIMNESPAMLKKMGKHLEGAALKAVQNALERVIDPSSLSSFFSLFEDD